MHEGGREERARIEEAAEEIGDDVVVGQSARGGWAG